VGGHGFAAYASASAHLDAYAQTFSGCSPWYAINWDACLPPGTGAATSEAATTLTAMALKADEIWATTLRVLAQRKFSRVAITKRPLIGRRHMKIAQADAPQTAEVRDRPEMETPYRAPRTELERVVAKEMGDLLGIDRIGVDDDFFALGGHSLLAIQAITRLRKLYGVELPMRALLYGTPTVAGIASVLEENLAEIDSATITAVENLLDDLEGGHADQDTTG
ncbi:MAG: phosphopantetheine-binding protein, partial [Pseudomonadota bacterium]